MKYRIQNKIYDTLKEVVNAQNEIQCRNRDKGIFAKDHEDATIHEYTEPLSTQDEYNNK